MLPGVEQRGCFLAADLGEALAQGLHDAVGDRGEVLAAGFSSLPRGEVDGRERPHRDRLAAELELGVAPAVVDAEGAIWSPLDEKPKAIADVRSLARVRDILARPAVTLLVQRWSEDWAELAWIRLFARATLVDRPPATVVAALRARYPQYAGHNLEHRPALRFDIERIVRWSAAD